MIYLVPAGQPKRLVPEMVKLFSVLSWTSFHNNNNSKKRKVEIAMTKKKSTRFNNKLKISDSLFQILIQVVSLT